MKRSTVGSFLIVMALTMIPHSAEAYIGPGAGIAAIGTVVALIGAILLAVVGFVWYPIKRLRARIKAKAPLDRTDQEA